MIVFVIALGVCNRVIVFVIHVTARRLSVLLRTKILSLSLSHVLVLESATTFTVTAASTTTTTSAVVLSTTIATSIATAIS